MGSAQTFDGLECSLELVLLDRTGAPANPTDLGMMRDIDEGGGLREFQTKQKRWQAKTTADATRNDAFAAGMISIVQEERALYDETYQKQHRLYFDEEG